MICTEGSYDPAKIWREVQGIDMQFESEKQEIIEILGYCPSPMTIGVRLR